MQLKRLIKLARRGAWVALGGLSLSGCSAGPGYYWQAARGHLQLLQSREPIEAVIAAPETDEVLRRQLTLAKAARDWAVSKLSLPDNGSYRSYADVGRPALLWNVFATPELSLAPRRWCHPFVGCMSYQGWFDQDQARRHAQALADDGWDTSVGAVSAYSTLGWFDDPLINTMARRGTANLIGTMFHELAHQKLYVRDDTAFNESYASFVEDEGLRQFMDAQGLSTAELTQYKARQRAFTELILQTRRALATLYAQDLGDEQKREGKQRLFEQLRQRYDQLKSEQWQGWSGYDAWFETPLNNARLLPFGLYDGWVDAFRTLFRREGGDWPRFHAAAEALGELPADERQAALAALDEVAP